MSLQRIILLDKPHTNGGNQPKAECIAADIIIDFSNGRGFYSSGNLNGNAATATKLQTARTINGVTFDGTTDISLTPENIGALSLSGGTLLGGLTAPLLTTKSDLIFSSHTSRHIRFTYTKNDGTTLTDGYIFKDGVDNPNRRPGIRINCAAPNKETGNGTNSGDWIFGEDGILPCRVALFFGEESIAMACRKVSINMTCSRQLLTMQKCICDVSAPAQVQAYGMKQ